MRGTKFDKIKQSHVPKFSNRISVSDVILECCMSHFECMFMYCVTCTPVIEND